MPESLHHMGWYLACCHPTRMPEVPTCGFAVVSAKPSHNKFYSDSPIPRTALRSHIQGCVPLQKLAPQLRAPPKPVDMGHHGAAATTEAAYELGHGLRVMGLSKRLEICNQGTP